MTELAVFRGCSVVLSFSFFSVFCLWSWDHFCLFMQEPAEYSPWKYSTVQGGIYVLEKAHMRSTSSLKGFSKVAFEQFCCSSDWCWQCFCLW